MIPESQLLEEFRTCLSDVLKPDTPDVELMKWLRSKNFNLKKAEMIFRQNLYTRKLYDLDNYETFETPEVAFKYEYTGFVGHDREGHAVRYVCFGRGDLVGFVMSMSMFQMGLYCAKLIESDLQANREESQRRGQLIHGVTYIVDLEELSLLPLANKMLIETALDLLQMLQDRYPEVWNEILFVNAPFYFHQAYAIFKPMLRSSLISKMHVYSAERSKEALLERVDASVLPAFLGGDRTDSNGDPFCTEFIRFGGKIPPEYYLKSRMPLMQETDEGVRCVWVAAGGYHNHALTVREAGTRVRAGARTEGGAIGLSILFKKLPERGDEEEEEEKEVVGSQEILDEEDEASGLLLVSPRAKIQAHLAPSEGNFRCPWPGTYIFRFENTYSWFLSMKVLFKIETEKPDEHPTL